MLVNLTRRGDYAIRAAITLARPGTGQLTGAELAGATGIPASYLPQIMGALVRKGIVANRRGRNGGYRLARSAQAITLLEVVAAADGGDRQRTCILRGGPCRGSRSDACSVHDSFTRAQQAVDETLGAVALADVAPPAPAPIATG